MSETKVKFSIEFGFLAAPMKEQLREHLPARLPVRVRHRLKTIDELNIAICNLGLHGQLTRGQVEACRKKLVKEVSKTLSEINGGEE
jgi:uncharacterized coiled-coil protein SlyX